ncbi:hypothetical protein [Scytonema sp. PRP1]|uniref:hypothetical protein n=1 Tax=Scytonema sp. PRP1 TaxID=3120513 RepID=UPI00300D3F26
MNTDINILPIIDLQSISQSLLTRIPQSELLAQLIILKGQFILVEREGKKCSYKFLSPEAVEKAFTSKTVTSGWLPSNTVWWGRTPAGEAIIQFYPPQKYRIQLIEEDTTVGGFPDLRSFSPAGVSEDSAFTRWELQLTEEGNPAEETVRPVEAAGVQVSVEEAKVITIPMPAFLFAGCGGKYYLWAVKGKVFKPDAQLYKPPLPNVRDDSSICFGENSPGTCSASTILQSWELFWKSPFNRDLAQGKSKTHPNDICCSLVSLHDSKARSYPSKDLVPTSAWKIKTPQDIINYLFS